MIRQNTGEKEEKSNAPKKPALTHFLCIPLVNSVSKPQLEASIGRFKEDECASAPAGTVREDMVSEKNDTVSTASTESSSKDAAASGDKSDKEVVETPAPIRQGPLIPGKAVRPNGSLHLTLGVMSLDEDKLAQAISLLQSLDPDEMLHESPTSKTNAEDVPERAGQSNSSDPPGPSFKADPLTLSLESLEPMQSPQKTSILYIKPRDLSNRLYPLCQALREAFTEAGLLVQDTRPLKLHATIVNTIYVKGRKRKGKSKKEGDKTTNAPAEGANADGKQTWIGATSETKPSTTETRPAFPQDKDTSLTANTPSSGHGPLATSSMYLNATSLISHYSSHIWASNIPISHIAICEMGVKKRVSPDGKVEEAYKEVGVREI